MGGSRAQWSWPLAAAAALACDGGPADPDPPTGTPNQRPVASFTVDATAGRAPLAVRFDASASTDPDGTIVSYAWTFGDGGTATGAVVTHTYTSAGTYVPTLVVTDARGATGNATGNQITVSSAAGTGENEITGVVWHDRNADGVRDDDEDVVPGMVVFLDENGDGLRGQDEAATVTDDEGAYRFEGLDGSRAYTVTQDLTLGWTNTEPGLPPEGAPGPRAVMHVGAGQPARIIGGGTAPEGKYPFQVALVTTSTQFQFCAGTFIAASWVLTASHCVDGTNPAAFKVLAGTHDLRVGGRLLDVRRTILHPNYSATAFVENDIALIELTAPQTYPRVELMTPARAELGAPGVMATVIGWGRTSISAGTGSPVLKELEAEIITNDACATQLDSNILPATICAGMAGSNESVCNGDSGGPLLVPYRSRWLQVGIVSFGANVCYQPTAFARVSSLVDFVQARVAPERSGSAVVDWSGGPTARVDFGNFR